MLLGCDLLNRDFPHPYIDVVILDTVSRRCAGHGISSSLSVKTIGLLKRYVKGKMLPLGHADPAGNLAVVATRSPGSIQTVIDALDINGDRDGGVYRINIYGMAKYGAWPAETCRYDHNPFPLMYQREIIGASSEYSVLEHRFLDTLAVPREVSDLWPCYRRYYQEYRSIDSVTQEIPRLHGPEGWY